MDQPQRHKDTELARLTYGREVQIPTIYKGRLLGTFRVDFIVEDAVVVEVKSVERMAPIFEAQLLTYLHLTQKRVGLLLNFNSPLMKDGITRRIV